GVIKNPLTYEIMTPQSVGLSGSSITIGKLSGRRGLSSKLAELGYELDGEALDALYRQAIALADEKKEVTDDDLVALVEQRLAQVPQAVRLEGWNVTSSHGGKATGMVSLAVGGEDHAKAAIGNGPVDALFAAVDEALQPVFGWHPVLEAYEIKAVSGGEDAQGRVLVRCRRSSDEGPGALVVSGHGLSTNIIEASIQAYLVAVNKLHGAGIGSASPALAGYRIASIGGDGVGPEVIASGRRVLDAVAARDGFSIDWLDVVAGGAAIDAFGTALRTEDLDDVAACDAVLLGAVGGPRWDDPDAKVRPEQALFALRGGLELFANLRPVTALPALVPSSPVRPEILDGTDLLIVRELTSGLYFGRPSEQRDTPQGRVGIDTLWYTEAEIRRVVRLAFELA